MHKRLVLYLLISIIAFFSNVHGAESEGMPQLNPEFWVSQIFWLIITFGFLFVILSKFILPKISNNLELRKSQILENIETAEKQKIESENKIKEEARNYFNEARKKIIQDIDKKKEKIEEEINLEIRNTEKEIVELKKSSPEKINKIAAETSAQLIKQLIGEEINNSSISAIVEDLSKKNKGKYYGN
jgi:F-type H+-transporting ATPase subunit b